MQAPLLRARGPGEILDAAFQLLRAHYTVVVLSSAVFLAPTIVLAFLLPELAPFIGILDRLLTLAASAVVAVVVSDIYTGQEADAGRSIRAVGRRFGSVWGAAILQGLLFLAGLLLLIVPAFIFYAWSFAMPVIVMLEGASASESYGRSRALAKGYVGHILATLAMAWVIFFVAIVGTMFAAGGAVALLGVDQRIIDALGGIVLCLLLPFVGVVTTLLYYDLRIRQEGFDVQLLASAMNDLDPDAPPAFA